MMRLALYMLAKHLFGRNFEIFCFVYPSKSVNKCILMCQKDLAPIRCKGIKSPFIKLNASYNACIFNTFTSSSMHSVLQTKSMIRAFMD